MRLPDAIMTPGVPEALQRVLHEAPKPRTEEDDLWQSVAARACLDAIGITGLQRDPPKHNRAVREARVWFRFDPDGLCEEVLENAGVPFERTRAIVLAEPTRFIGG